MFDLTVLGTSASVPSAHRNHPGLLVEAGGYRIIVDCGDKAQSALDKAEPEHAEKTGAIQAEADAIEKSTQAENARWKKEKERLDARCSARGARVPRRRRIRERLRGYAV